MRLRIISEAGYGRTYSFDYQNAQTDKRPRLLLLGKWRHPTTRNFLLAGINMNYLSDEQLAEVRKNLKAIIQPRNLKSRYWKGRQLLPDVFQNAYRTYDKDYVGSITKDTLKFWPTDEALEQAEKEAQDTAAKQKEADIKKAAAPAAPAAPGAPSAAAPGAPAVPAAPGPEAPVAGPDVGEVEAPGEPPKAKPAKAAKPAPKTPEAPTKTARQRRLKPAPAPAAPATTAAPTAAAPVQPTELAQPVEPKPIQPAEPKDAKITSAQKRKKQAQQIEKAIQRTNPQPKPEPPPEIGGAVNLFKPKK